MYTCGVSFPGFENLRLKGHSTHLPSLAEPKVLLWCLVIIVNLYFSQAFAFVDDPATAIEVVAVNKLCIS